MLGQPQHHSPHDGQGRRTIPPGIMSPVPWPGAIPPEPTQGVWVRLDALYTHPADAPETSVPDGWDLIGNVPGVLRSRSWIRSARGMWLAACNFALPSADGLRVHHLANQLIPAYALSPRR